MAAKVPFLAVVAESFHGEAEELSLTEGTEVIVVQCDGDGWYTIHTKDAIGIFPGSYLDVVEEIRLPIKAKVVLPFIELNLLPGDIVTVNDISVEGWMIEAKNTIGYCTWDYLDIILGGSAVQNDVDIVIPDIKKSANTSSLIGIKPIQSEPKVDEPSPINPVKNSLSSTLPNNSNVNRPVSTAANPVQQRPPSVTAPNQSRPTNAPGPRGSPGTGPRGGPRPLSTSTGSQPNRGRPLSSNFGSPALNKSQQNPPPTEPKSGTPPPAPARRPTVTGAANAPQPPARKPTVGSQTPPVQSKPAQNSPAQSKPVQKGVSIAPSARDKKPNPGATNAKGGPSRATIMDTKPGEMVTSRYSTYRRPVSIFAGTFQEDNVYHDPYFLSTMRGGAKVELEGRFEFRATEHLPSPPSFSGCQKAYVTLMPSYIDWEAKIRSAQFDI